MKKSWVLILKDVGGTSMHNKFQPTVITEFQEMSHFGLFFVPQFKQLDDKNKYFAINM